MNEHPQSYLKPTNAYPLKSKLEVVMLCRWHVITLAIPAGLALLACEETPLQSNPSDVAVFRAGVDQNVWTEVSGTWYDQCTGEIYDWWGEDHWVTHTRLDASGGYHTNQHGNLKYTGVGQVSGTAFVGNVLWNQHFVAPSSGSLSFSWKVSDKAVAKGSAQNTRIVLWDRHVTINANGEETVARSIPEKVTCGGAE